MNNQVKIICCFCGEKLDYSLFNDHILNCLDECYLNFPDRVIKKIYQKILDTNSQKELSNEDLKEINKKSFNFFKNLYSKFQQVYDFGLSLSDLQCLVKETLEKINNYNLNKFNKIKFQIKCVKCGEYFNYIQFLNHIYTCFLNDNKELENYENLICILYELIDHIVSEKINENYVNFLYDEYLNYFPLINQSSIFCYICGNNVPLNNFEIHYSSCKAEFEHKNKIELKDEPEILNKIIDILFDDEEINIEELQEYSIEANKYYKKLYPNFEKNKSEKWKSANWNMAIYKDRYIKEKSFSDLQKYLFNKDENKNNDISKNKNYNNISEYKLKNEANDKIIKSRSNLCLNNLKFLAKQEMKNCKKIVMN